MRLLAAYFIFILDHVFFDFLSDIIDIEIIFDCNIGDFRGCDLGKIGFIFSGLLSSFNFSFFIFLSLLCGTLSTSSFGGFCSFDLTLLLSLNEEALVSLIFSLLDILFLFFFACVVLSFFRFFFTVSFFVVVFS